MNRAAFMSIVHSAMNEEAARKVEMAYQFSKMVHRGQFRKELDAEGQPQRYFEHLRRACLIVLTEAGIVNDDILCAVLLHDAIEDTEDVMLVSTMIERLFGSNVARDVRLVTKVPKEGYIERLRRSLPENLIVGGSHMVVKAADRLDNLRSLPKDDQAFCEKQRKETRDVYLPLFAIADEKMPHDWKAGFRKIVAEIRSLT